MLFFIFEINLNDSDLGGLFVKHSLVIQFLDYIMSHVPRAAFYI